MLSLSRVVCTLTMAAAGFLTLTTVADTIPTRTVEIHAKRFAFSPSEITIPKGTPVTLALTSDDAPHSLLVEGLGVNAPMTKGNVTHVTVTPKQAGDFKGRCGRFCGSGHGMMTFTVHVTDN